MSYIEKEIGGKKRGLKFNQGAHIIFLTKIDKDNYAATTGYALVFAGLKMNAYVKGEEFTTSFETVSEWVDELKEEDVLEIINCYKEIQAYQSLIKTDKKKLVHKNTKRSALK